MTDQIGRITRNFWALAGVLICLSAAPGLGQQDAFAPGWTLEPGASSLRFQSVKNETVVESSGFATFSGAIDPAGLATIRILLDSVDTKIDLRNVRMRFLFFESFQYPEAVITARIDPAALADLPQLRRKTVPLAFTLDLHGVKKQMSADVVVTQLADSMVAVSTGAPIPVMAADHNLTGGVEKLQEAAGVRIIPSATVTFDFVFSRTGAAPAPAPVATPAQAALETAGALDAAACKGRFEILSRSGNIFFASGSARLDAKSAPLLDSLADITNRCPGMRIEVGGHTDADGSAAQNQRLSQARAQSVADYLRGKGIAADRLTAVGYGEDKPVAANDTAENKARNRRIEFRVIDG